MFNFVRVCGKKIEMESRKKYELLNFSCLIKLYPELYTLANYTCERLRPCFHGISHYSVNCGKNTFSNWVPIITFLQVTETIALIF